MKIFIDHIKVMPPDTPIVKGSTFRSRFVPQIIYLVVRISTFGITVVRFSFQNNVWDTSTDIFTERNLSDMQRVSCTIKIKP